MANRICPKSFLTLIIGITGILMTLFVLERFSLGEAPAVQASAVHAPPIRQLIIKYKDASTLGATQAQSSTQMQRISDAARMSLEYFRPMAGRAHVLQLPEWISVDEALEITDRLAALPEVAYAEPDYIVQAIDDSLETPLLVPNDTYTNCSLRHHEWINCVMNGTLDPSPASQTFDGFGIVG